MAFVEVPDPSLSAAYEYELGLIAESQGLLLGDLELVKLPPPSTSVGYSVPDSVSAAFDGDTAEEHYATYLATDGTVSEAELALKQDAATAATDAELQGLGAQVMIVVNHGANPNVARPVGAAAVWWVGTVEPANMNQTSDVYSAP